MDIETIKEKLRNYLNESNESIYRHSLLVQELSIELAKHYNFDVEKASIAALLHDCGRKCNADEIINFAENAGCYITEVTLSNPIVLHGFVGSIIAKQEFNIDDMEILAAIRDHTTGASEMTNISKVVFVADKLDPEKTYIDNTKLKEIAFENLDKAILYIFDQTLKFLIDNNFLIFEQIVTSRNKIIMKLRRTDIF